MEVRPSSAPPACRGTLLLSLGLQAGCGLAWWAVWKQEKRVCQNPGLELFTWTPEPQGLEMVTGWLDPWCMLLSELWPTLER